MVTFPQNANVTASKLFKSNGGKKYEEKTRKPVFTFFLFYMNIGNTFYA